MIPCGAMQLVVALTTTIRFYVIYYFIKLKNQYNQSHVINYRSIGIMYGRLSLKNYLKHLIKKLSSSSSCSIRCTSYMYLVVGSCCL